MIVDILTPGRERGELMIPFIILEARKVRGVCRGFSVEGFVGSEECAEYFGAGTLDDGWGLGGL